MDSDFMTNLANMLKNGNIPNDVKEKMGQFMNQESTNEKKDESNTSYTDSNDNNNSNKSSINPDMLKNLMGFLNNANSNSCTESESNNSSSPGIDINTLLKMKSIMDKIGSNKNDPRANLLLSLKPYLKESRKSKIEQYIQLFHMTKIMEAFSENGGEKTK